MVADDFVPIRGSLDALHTMGYRTVTVFRMTPEQVRAHQARIAKARAPAYGVDTITRETIREEIYSQDWQPFGRTKPEPSPAFVASFGKAKDVVAEYMDGTRARKFTLRLPWPPTLNSNTLPTMTGGRILTPEHKTFRAEVAYAVYQAKIPKLYGKLRVSIVAHPPDNRPRDLDNIVKPTLDAMQRAGAIENDRHVDDLHIMRSTVIPRGTIDVEVGEL